MRTVVVEVVAHRYEEVVGSEKCCPSLYPFLNEIKKNLSIGCRDRGTPISYSEVNIKNASLSYDRTLLKQVGHRFTHHQFLYLAG